MTSFIESINTELNNLVRLDNELIDDPVVPEKHTFAISNPHNREYFYHITSVDGKIKRIYLGNANSPKLHQLARSSYKKELMKIVRHNIKILKKLLNDYKSYSKSDVLAKLSPCLHSVQFETNFDSVMLDLQKWAKAEYKKNSLPFKDQVILAKDGTRVRSKSECIIYNELLDAGIPFRYDPVLIFRKKNQYGEYEEVQESPDFQIKLPDGSYILIEHGGFLESIQYATTLANKIQLYQLNGYILGYSLFVTSDTINGGINSAQIEQLIQFVCSRFAYL